MRRMAIVAVCVGIGVLVVRALGANLHERLSARCEAMFDQMPDTFPPKRMMRDIEQIRVETTRILELLEVDKHGDTIRVPETPAREAVHHAA